MKNARTPKHRNWCFTAFKEPVIDTGSVSYYIYQKEKCPKTGKEHYQGYIEFDEVRRLSECKNVFTTEKVSVHVEPRKGTQEQAIAYCMKSETAVGEPVKFGKPKQQGNRSDIDALWETIAQGHTARETLHAHGGTALRYINAVIKALEAEHEVLAIDKTIIANRRSYRELQDHLSKNASEVAGNTVPQQLDEYYQYARAPTTTQPKGLVGAVVTGRPSDSQSDSMTSWKQLVPVRDGNKNDLSSDSESDCEPLERKKKFIKRK